MSETPFRNISDTALWAAEHRALETERPDALFRDPFARRLAGTRGTQMVSSAANDAEQAWAWVTRTVLFDRFVSEAVAAGVDTVVNLAAGLDARPYRMALPSTLRWIEIDLPDLLQYKESVLGNERSTCVLERTPLDLMNVAARVQAFHRIGEQSKRAIVVSEGLLAYLQPEEVAALARDIAAIPAFEHWVVDVMSPGLKRMLDRQVGRHLEAAGAPFKFAPEEGPGFFVSHGWEVLSVQGLLKNAARLKRLSFVMRLIALLPESTGRQGQQPWSGVCLLKRTGLVVRVEVPRAVGNEDVAIGFHGQPAPDAPT